MLINHASKQVTAKIVYYGAGLSGKTTNLQYIFSVTHPRSRGELVSMETEIERTIFFDLLPMNVGTIKGYQTKFQLYTVPGQVFYDSTRKLVLRGVDGIVFVVDSQELMRKANIESLENLRENLGFYGGRLTDMPLVFQYNKRDLKSIMPVEQMNEELNQLKRPWNEAVAKSGSGVIETLRKISNLTLVKIRETLEQVEGTEAKGTVSFDMHASMPKEKLEIETPHFRRISIEDHHEGLQTKRPLLTEFAANEAAKEHAAAKEREAAREAAIEAELEKAQKASSPMSAASSPMSAASSPMSAASSPTSATSSPTSASPPPIRETPPGDGIIRRAGKIPRRDTPIIVEVKGKGGELLTSFIIDTPKDSRKVDIVLEIEP